mmetsp:Transcript_5382/g.11823  ORF Transcript_5382/g.11823 Transcript_5382/m.11823 type:complete len:327 (-) Transcript_5382:2030-3010(-)|eukprot:CAMPEP_0202893682 /NCGR_PEP_ID=MMETSP1392-20130828/3222_1 /ASSEMBLY_ACC=CAM_ASM_000868 /TAXON_ID=225041 /ORGANISM="Chlamydomonas chlamydogama, Strain SAG 11-48b" /LENGTH=326 /DNA_ID=CAMNT_0049578109 /DNA_START=145 /DNA_END=1125 /DNA_ORIENTATION=-
MASTAEGQSTDFSIFVGDLAADVDDNYLLSFFAQYFPSVRTAKVITDPATGRSRGYGFVRFSSEGDRDRALNEMNGVYISTRPIRVSLATAKKPGQPGQPGEQAPRPSNPAPPGGSAHVGDYDPNNTTLFIGGLAASVTEEQLRNVFLRYGDIVYVKIPQGKGCGFVQFVDRRAAEVAMSEMSGAIIGNSAVRISWGRASNKPGHAGGTYPAASSYGATSYPAYSMYPYDPYSGYAMYADPYAASYGAYPGMDYMGYPGYMVPGYGAVPGVHSHGSSGGGSTGQQSGSSQPTVYDPLAPPSVDKLNAAYMHRHIPVLTGSFLRMRV